VMDDEEDRGHLYGFGDPSAKQTRLQEIVEQRVRDVAEAKARLPEAELRARADAFVAEHGPPLCLVGALEAAEASPWGLALAAEFKRASPSKGDIAADMDAGEQALKYSKVGAGVLSVLTEPKWFKGTLEDLKDVRLKTQQHARERGTRRPACLRKDFLVDEYQVLEALAHGADTALLMVSILPLSRLRALIGCCREHGLEPLVEVVTERELRVAVAAGARVLGVNNRDLHTFKLEKERTNQVAQWLREDHKMPFGPGHPTKLMALSGLSTAEDVEGCRKIACSGVLVGEALMRAADPGAAILEMMGAADEAVLPVAPGSVIVKVCGVVRPDDARCAITAGANLIGVIFAKSKRQASVDQAKDVVETVRKFGERTACVPAQSREPRLDTIAGLTERCKALRGACKRTPLVVGVFMDQPLEQVVELATASGVDAIQLHGAEDTGFVTELRRLLPGAWVLKVVHIPARSEADGAAAEADGLRDRLASYAGCDALLLDTSVKGGPSGGTGAAFDWEVARKAQEAWGVPVIVAGGLTDANVAELVTSVCPYGVDVASGVEDSPGVKNSEKTTAYVRQAKRARLGGGGD